MPIPTRSEYTFKGWTGSNGTTGQTSVIIQKGSRGNKTYTANWQAYFYFIKNGQTNYTWVKISNDSGGWGNSTMTNENGYLKFAAPGGSSYVRYADVIINFSNYTTLKIKARTYTNAYIAVFNSSGNYTTGSGGKYGCSIVTNGIATCTLNNVDYNGYATVDTWNHGYAEIYDMWLE